VVQYYFADHHSIFLVSCLKRPFSCLVDEIDARQKENNHSERMIVPTGVDTDGDFLCIIAVGGFTAGSLES
jgi:hypothetical protein